MDRIDREPGGGCHQVVSVRPSSPRRLVKPIESVHLSGFTFQNPPKKFLGCKHRWHRLRCGCFVVLWCYLLYEKVFGQVEIQNLGEWKSQKKKHNLLPIGGGWVFTLCSTFKLCFFSREGLFFSPSFDRHLFPSSFSKACFWSVDPDIWKLTSLLPVVLEPWLWVLQRDVDLDLTHCANLGPCPLQKMVGSTNHGSSWTWPEMRKRTRVLWMDCSECCMLTRVILGFLSLVCSPQQGE